MKIGKLHRRTYFTFFLIPSHHFPLKNYEFVVMEIEILLKIFQMNRFMIFSAIRMAYLILLNILSTKH